MSRQRRSLKDRDEFAIATPPTAAAPDATSTETGTAAPDRASTKKQAPSTVSTPRAGAISGATTSRVGIYFRPGQFDEAKAAYLADWQAGGEADTFGRWIADAIDRYARTTTQARADGLRLLEQYGSETRGLTRSFNIPDSTIDRLRDAQRHDRDANQWTSQSEFCAGAIASAIATAKQRAGGQLATPPRRLPNRLTR